MLCHANSIDGVIVQVFTFSAVDSRFEPRSSQTKYWKIGMCCSIKDQDQWLIDLESA
jgi:hypothetical protein